MSKILQIRWRFFFYFDKILKVRILQPKNASSEGCKKSPGKKVIKSKNGWSKSCPKFCKLGDDFFLFWRNLKNEAATAEKRYFNNVPYIHNKSCIFSPGAPKNQNYDEKFKFQCCGAALFFRLRLRLRPSKNKNGSGSGSGSR